MRISGGQVHPKPKYEQGSQAGKVTVFRVDANVPDPRILEGLIHSRPVGIQAPPLYDVSMFDMLVGDEKLKSQLVGESIVHVKSCDFQVGSLLGMLVQH